MSSFQSSSDPGFLGQAFFIFVFPPLVNSQPYHKRLSSLCSTKSTVATTTSDQLVVICYLILSLLGHSTASDLLLVAPVTILPGFPFIYLFMVVLGLHCYVGFSLAVASGNCSLVS